MWWLFGLALVVVACFSLVLLRGAPYLPTLRPQVTTAFELLELRPGETMLELGCGDGKVLVAAAQRGIKSIGYELNPLLAGVAWLRTRRYRRLVRVVWGDYWLRQWPEHQAIFAFLLPRFMDKLDKKITQESSKPVKLVSFAFTIPGRRATTKSAGIFRYDYK
jgi:hypothetical protein